MQKDEERARRRERSVNDVEKGDEDFHVVTWNEVQSVEEREIDRSHWVPPHAASRCSACDKRFNFLTKQNWCFCCGHVFCKQCVSRSRPLNRNGQPDAGSDTSYPVCLHCSTQDNQLQDAVHSPLSPGEASKTAIVDAALDPEDFHLVTWGEVKNAEESDIDRTHWLHPSAASSCFGCEKQFNVFIKRNWCFCCGRVFCKICVSYKRPLNQRAEPDPSSDTSCEVCLACYVRGRKQQELGMHVSHTSSFLAQRRKLLKERDADIRQASQKLVHAYMTQKQAAPSSSMLSLLSRTLKRSDWTKVNVTDVKQQAPACCACEKLFGLFHKKHACRICGYPFCDTCLFASVELYEIEKGMEDSQGHKSAGTAKITILHPELEHEHAVILRACDHCLSRLERATHVEKQVLQKRRSHRLDSSGDGSLSRSLSLSQSHSHSQKRGKDDANTNNPHDGQEEEESVFDRIISMYNTKLHELWQSSLKEMSLYSEHANAIRSMSSSSSSSSSLSSRGSIKDLVRAQIDLDEAFSLLHSKTLLISKLLKRHRRELSKTQTIVVGHLVQCFLHFYQAKIGLFRSLKHDLSAVLPSEVVSVIEAELSSATLRFALITLEQLGVELLAFPSLEQLAPLVIEALHEVTCEWEKAITLCAGQHSADDDMRLIKQLIRQNGKDKPLIRQHAGSPAWPEKVLEAWDAVLKRVSAALNTRATRRMADSSRHAVVALWKEGCRLLQTAAEV